MGVIRGRAGAVAVWTELHCPRNLSAASLRSLFVPLPPLTRSPFAPIKHTHMLCILHTHTVLFTVSHLSHSIPLGVSSAFHEAPSLLAACRPSSRSLLRPRPCDCHSRQTVRSENIQSSHLHHLVFHTREGSAFLKRSRRNLCFWRLIGPCWVFLLSLVATHDDGVISHFALVFSCWKDAVRFWRGGL